VGVRRAFSPLIIGEWTATAGLPGIPREAGSAFSPLIIGEWTATARSGHTTMTSPLLSVP